MSEPFWTVTMLNSMKDCLNLHRNILVIFADHSEKELAPKILF